MADQQNEHIDLYFKAGFEKLEIRYNEAHWQSLASALTGASSVNADTPKVEHWVKKLLRQLYNPNVIVGLVISGIAMTMMMTTQKTNDKNLEKTQEETTTIQQQQSVDSTVLFGPKEVSETMEQQEKRHNISPLSLDSTSTGQAATHDSIDSLNVDSLKLKNDNFIFWY